MVKKYKEKWRLKAKGQQRAYDLDLDNQSYFYDSLNDFINQVEGSFYLLGIGNA